MLFNKNVEKKILVGVAAMALFAPVALGGGQSHASLQDVFNQSDTEQAAKKATQESRELERSQGTWSADGSNPKEAKL